MDYAKVSLQLVQSAIKWMNDPGPSQLRKQIISLAPVDLGLKFSAAVKSDIIRNHVASLKIIMSEQTTTLDHFGHFVRRAERLMSRLWPGRKRRLRINPFWRM